MVWVGLEGLGSFLNTCSVRNFDSLAYGHALLLPLSHHFSGRGLLHLFVTVLLTTGVGPMFFGPNDFFLHLNKDGGSSSAGCLDF